MRLRNTDTRIQRAALPATLDAPAAPAAPSVLTVLTALAALTVLRWFLADGAAGLLLDAALALAAAAGTIEAARRASPGRSRLGWRCDTAGLLMWLLAPLAWLTGLPEAVALAGRCGLVLLLGAAWWFTSRAPNTWSRVRMVVDGTIVGGAVFVLAWPSLLYDVGATAGWGTMGALAVALPLAAIAVLILVGGVSVTEIPRHRRGMPRMFMAAFAVISLSDVLWVDPGRPLWAVGFACVLVATRLYRGTSERHGVMSTHPVLVHAPYAVLAPAVVALLVQFAGDGISRAVGVTSVVIGVLLLVRQHATLSENRTLVERLEATERRLRHQALHDSLTGLGGRAMLHERLDAAVAAYREDATPVAVVFIDLDDFKQVNDVHGHAAGDHVLVAIARRLARALAPLTEGATAFRMSGDEFAVLLHGEAAADPAGTARALLAEISAPVEVADVTVAVGGSVGVAVPAADVPAESSALLRAADVAMYGVKHAGKGGVAQSVG